MYFFHPCAPLLHPFSFMQLFSVNHPQTARKLNTQSIALCRHPSNQVLTVLVKHVLALVCVHICEIFLHDRAIIQYIFPYNPLNHLDTKISRGQSQWWHFPEDQIVLKIINGEWMNQPFSSLTAIHNTTTYMSGYISNNASIGANNC